MPGFLIRLAITAAGLWLAAEIVPGIVFDGAGSLLLAAFLMGIVNALFRPVVVLLTFPLTIVTFGLFLLVVNAAMFGLVALLLPGFRVSGFFAALFGWLIVSVVGWAASWFIGSRGRYEIAIVERHDR
ncbi:MAG: phage holin family protein [Gammaproteobacteria bacterium]|nr:phage holin family protein [Gammaproteobacteria bacterium]